MSGVRACGLMLAVAGAFALAACGKSEDKTPGQKLDAAIEQAQRKGDEAKAMAEKGLGAAKSAANDAARDADKALSKAADATREPREQAARVIGDAAITTKIKAQLAQDADLSALDVKVETVQGRVKLSGSAPSDEARERATKLARAVEGVSGVDNEIAVKPR